MIHYKSPEDIQKMQEGGHILSIVLKRLLAAATVGTRLHELDQIAEKEIRHHKATPSFQRVKGYSWSICACVNDVVVHGIPDAYVLRDGDIVGLDCGVYYKGFHTDAAWTIAIGSAAKNPMITSFLAAGKQALHLALEKAKEGNYIYDCSLAMQQTIESAGYNVMRSLVGHGVGKELHEDPEVPCYTHGKRKETPRIQKGMVLAIEVIYAMGKAAVEYRGNDGWTIVTKDGTLSGLFEATVAITSHGSVVLTETSLP